LYIFNLNAYSFEHEIHLQKSFSSDDTNRNDIEISLPNGRWYFYGSVYYNLVNPSVMATTQWIRCFYLEESLDGLNKEINLTIKQDNCAKINKDQNTQLPKIAFRRYLIGRGEDVFGSDRSIKISLLNIKPYKANSKDSLQIISMVDLYPMSNSGLGVSKCYSLTETQAAPGAVNQDYFQLPFSPVTQEILPTGLYIQGYLDVNCQTPNPNSGHVVYNRWLSNGHSLIGTQLDFVQHVEHRSFTDSNPTELYWTKPSGLGDQCVDNDNCTPNICNDEKVCEADSGGGG